MKEENELIRQESHKRYEALRDRFRLNDSQIAKRIGSDSSRFTDWKKKSLPNAILLVKIASLLNTSVEYLLTGKEISNQNNEFDNVDPELIIQRDKLFSLYIKLSDNGRMKLMERAETLIDMGEIASNEHREEDHQEDQGIA